jgi:hypothetical protein
MKNLFLSGECWKVIFRYSIKEKATGRIKRRKNGRPFMLKIERLPDCDCEV